MIIARSSLIDLPVMSLQTGGELARTKEAIINPDNLQIVAYELSGHNLVDSPTLLRLADIRELSNSGLIVDSDDEFIRPEDVIKINEIYQLHFNPIGMQVVDEKKSKLGRVHDYTLNTADFHVQQLVISRPLLKSLNDTELIVHRSQIIEINNKAIVVHSETEAPEPDRSEVIGSYVNPFRKPETSADSSQRVTNQSS